MQYFQGEIHGQMIPEESKEHSSTSNELQQYQQMQFQIRQQHMTSNNTINEENSVGYNTGNTGSH